MKRYLLFLEETCPRCRGTGVVVHPDWAWVYELERELGRFLSLEEAAQHLGLLTPEHLPPEEVPCGECGGEGRLRKEVPLEEALAELGVLKGAPSSPPLARSRDLREDLEGGPAAPP